MLKKVLHVDDQKIIRELVEFGFEDTDIDLLSVSCFDQFLQSLHIFKPDVVLLDALLDDCNIIDLVNNINKQGISPPIIFLSSLDEQTLFAQGKPINLLGVITKPFIPQKLPEQVSALFNQKLNSKLVYTRYNTEGTSNSRLSQLRLKYQQHLKNTIHDIEDLWNVIQPEKDCSDVLKKLIPELHKISGTAGIHNMFTISEIAGQLEELLRQFEIKNTMNTRDLIRDGSTLFHTLINEIKDL
ncbi:response regulator [Zooshikella harenae]|uniref:Response regulator n=1 Tax=Zooshikella harenae TaxID=2827238 RepID=A0ABS5ZK43_9GAMM|nr:response regulator [Zooshikella harenae]MBU2713595.1 response regulator [Zooshikella harenae]